MNKARVGILTALVLVTRATVSWAGESVPCYQVGTSLVVSTAGHKLWLCKADSVQGEYPIAIGSGGTDKFKEGDEKTPLGEYLLDEPRPSNRFALFIPVGYPTERQRKEGRTGGEIGVHGPPRMWRWLGGLTTWTDWTKGCVAVGTTREIEEVSAWVRKERVSRIILR